MDYLKLDELKDGYLYRIRARNGAFGIWRAEKSGFILSRVKFDANYTFMEYHYDTGAPLGTVKPLQEIEPSPFTKNFEEDEVLDYLNDFEIPLALQSLVDAGYTPEDIKDRPMFSFNVMMRRREERQKNKKP